MYYTEYLPRIQSITAVLDFEGQAIADISGITTSSQDLIITTKSHKSYKLRLPITLEGPLKLSNIKVAPKECLSISIQVTEPSVNPETPALSFMAHQTSKWSCQDLNQKTPKDRNNQSLFSFNCGSCGSMIVDSGSYKFLDMPSEFWYEMMDFWHCHKPHNNESHTKDYAGSLKPPNDFSVIIGSYYLLLNKSPKLSVTNSSVKCSKCDIVVGDVFEGSNRINKWDLSLNYNTTEKAVCETFSSHLFIYNSILDKVNSLATRKFKFYYRGQWWFLWIMNIGLDISIGDMVLNKTMKILYFNDDNDDSKATEDYEILKITYDNIIQDFTSQLQNFNELLPRSNRVLLMDGKDFKVSYLSQDSVNL